MVRTIIYGASRQNAELTNNLIVLSGDNIYEEFLHCPGLKIRYLKRRKNGVHPGKRVKNEKP